MPTGRYLAPPSDPDCVAIYVGDCGTARQINLRGPLFSRWDMRLKKRFPFAKTASVEFIVEMLNVFDTSTSTIDADAGASNRTTRSA